VLITAACLAGSAVLAVGGRGARKEGAPCVAA